MRPELAGDGKVGAITDNSEKVVPDMTDRLYFPYTADAARVRRETLLSQAGEAYKAFYPAVSVHCLIQDNIGALGVVPNVTIGLAAAIPLQDALTANSDTPYGVMVFDLDDGPIVVDQPASPVLGLFDSLYFNLVGNSSLVGPDQGQAFKYSALHPP